MDDAIGFPLDIKIRCHGEYSYKITNPMLFYTNVCANIESDYTRDRIDSQLKTELLTALQQAIFRISEDKIYYGAIPAYTGRLADELNDILSAKWRDRRGIEIVEFGVSSVNATEEDEARISEYQRSAALGRDARLAGGHLAGATATAMVDAANNESGAGMAFMGMGMAQNIGGMGAQSMYQMAQNVSQQPTMTQQSVPIQNGEPQWACQCGATNTGKFCQNCGAKQPQSQQGWACQCGATNTGKFCQNCGSARPQGAPLFKCDKCGWQPEDPQNPPRFCPECGDVFDDNDKNQ